MNDFMSYIAANNEIRFGKPCIKGTRITVQDILQWLANGMSYNDIITDYPELNEIHIRAALAYAYH
ncbi:MAG: DUF433 domain-containing protein [Spirochaetaceae bacterium]|jgi:uncharacterized protein (DUF433 family)|nr:DUF433 domain-containing protein [Spirochaetaceae bacterium]